MGHIDGHCATDAETIYVQNVTGCLTTTGGGTLAAPFCTARLGVNVGASTSGKSLVLLTGALADFSVAVSSKSLTVVGKSAVITPALATNAIDITSGEVYLRGLTVQGAATTGMGINAAPPGGSTVTLHMNSCTVSNNPGGGILLNGAAFDIQNTTVTGNGPNTASTPWGGIYVQSLPTSGPTALSFVTIQNNPGPGLVCAPSASIQGTAVLAIGNTLTQITSACAVTSCTPDAGTACGAQ
jgi:hypothetical protein